MTDHHIVVSPAPWSNGSPRSRQMPCSRTAGLTWMSGRSRSSRAATRRAPPTCRCCTWRAGGWRRTPRSSRWSRATTPRTPRSSSAARPAARSLQAAALLEAAGYTNVVDMRGGFHGERDNFGRVAVAGWAESGLPVETSAPPEKTYAELEKRAEVRNSASPRRARQRRWRLLRRPSRRSSGRGRGRGCGSCRPASRRRGRRRPRP